MPAISTLTVHLPCVHESQDSWEDSVWAQDEPSPPESAGADQDNENHESQDEGSASKSGLRGQKASRFVDSEAGRSSGSEADDDAAEEDDEVGSIDGFVVKDEEATSSNYESDSEEEVKKPPASRLTRLRRGRDSIELDAEAAAEAQLGRSLRGLSIMRIEAGYAA